MTATATTFPMLPTCPARQTGETAQAYGLRVLAFVLAEDVTATLDSESLELALHTSVTAVAAPEMHAGALERVQRTRGVISSALRRRRADAEFDAELRAAIKAAKEPKPVVDDDDDDDKGQRVPRRRPTPIQPPPSVAARL